MTGRTLPGRCGVVHLRRLEGDEIGVASIALRRARDMGPRFAQGADTVTAAATPGHRRRRQAVIEDGCGPAAGRGMAGVALGRRADMGHRLALGILRNKTARVTTRTLAVQTGMIHLGRNKGDIVLVTGIARRVAGDVGRGLARRIASVVAGGAGSG